MQTCGIDSAETRQNIINGEGFTRILDLGVLETDTDVTEMAKRMAARTQAECLLGTVVIKRLQTLVWWVRDCRKRGLEITANDFDEATMEQAAQTKIIDT